MLAEVLESSSVQRLRGILRNRYGMGLQVNFMMDVASVDLSAQSPSVSGGDLRIPIATEGKYLATAIIPDAGTASVEVAQQIFDLVQMVLTPAILNWHAKQQEYNLRLQLAQTVGKFPGIELQAPAFLIESKSAQVVSKAAVQIHEIAERWAFLRWRDVQPQVKHMVNIKELGAMTLFIEDVLMLTPQEQLLIADYLVQADLKNEPLLVFGANMPLHQIIAKGLLVTQLAKILQDNRLEADRLPQNFSEMKETLELVLDRKALLN